MEKLSEGNLRIVEKHLKYLKIGGMMEAFPITTSLTWEMGLWRWYKRSTTYHWSIYNRICCRFPSAHTKTAIISPHYYAPYWVGPGQGLLVVHLSGIPVLALTAPTWWVGTAVHWQQYKVNVPSLMFWIRLLYIVHVRFSHISHGYRGGFQRNLCNLAYDIINREYPASWIFSYRRLA